VETFIIPELIDKCICFGYIDIIIVELFIVLIIICSVL